MWEGSERGKASWKPLQISTEEPKKYRYSRHSYRITQLYPQLCSQLWERKHVRVWRYALVRTMCVCTTDCIAAQKY